jgi:hypothetical protein
MLAGAACAPMTSDIHNMRAPNERLFYELEVTLPGTRSQGVRGRLYDQQGRPVIVGSDGSIAPETAPHVTPGGRIATNAGVFVMRPQAHLWDVSGMIHEAMLGADGVNDPSVDGPILFRLYVTAECTRSEGWRGELHFANTERAPMQRGSLRTPMGRFVFRTSEHLWGQRGWFPESWPAPMVGADHWPCGR